MAPSKGLVAPSRGLRNEGEGKEDAPTRRAGGRAQANALTEAARGVAFAPTLGDVGTTLSHPASSSHRGLSEEARAALGITEGFFRVSVGLEEPGALIAEFTRAVAAARAI